MNVQAGSRLGPYEIVASVGAGGMGEVYRARDTRLNRTVAIKVLSRVSPKMRDRFEREARAISSLSHPNICALFDVGSHDGTEYLVMEFLDGETLADRLSRGPLPIDQVLRYGIEIAEALNAAHKVGIVHRDLKPGNIVITKTGAKLLDFGLAKAIAEEPAAESTLQKPLTDEGVVVGTVQYMAPEQLEGKEADARTDIFAFGATLYEMATGKRAFEGTSRATLIASILDRQPVPLTELQPMTPPALDRVVRGCLAKDPDDRWQNAHDVAAELRWIAEGTTAVGTRGPRRVPRRVLWGLAGLIAGLAIGATAIWLSARGRVPATPIARFTIPLPASAPFNYGNVVGLAISPDGTRFVYTARSGATTKLYLRALGQTAPVPIAGTEGGIVATFSPDGRSIAFSSSGRLQRVSLDGGLPVQLARGPGPPWYGIRWVGENIYYAPEFTSGIWMVPDAGGTPREIIRANPQKRERALVWPEVLPDGRTIITTVWTGGSWDDAKIVAYPIGGGEPKVIIEGGTCARYAKSGHLLYARGGSLYAAPFDPGSLRITGTSVPVVNGVASGVLNGDAQYGVSDNGVLVYAGGGVLQNRRSLLWIDRHGREQPVVPTQRPYNEPALSPDGRTIAVTLENATFDVWLLDIERDSMTRVSFGGDDARPLWTPDGRRILWTSSRVGHLNVFWAPADNSGSEERLTNSPHNEFGTAVSPDGHFVAITQRNQGKLDLNLVSLSVDRKEQPFLATPFNEQELSFSPDGKWVAYISDESGRDEAYLRPMNAQGGKWQISIDGAIACRWAHNGREITYFNHDQLFVVPVETQPQVRIGKPQLLFQEPLPGSPFNVWDLSPDDEKILWVKPESLTTIGELQIVLNWFPELKRRAPSR